jgi:phosphoglycolate phosphatase-like HAD superfamily hydrolase
MVAGVHARLRSGEITADDLRVPGSPALLEAAKERFGADVLYVASGTDIGPILRSVELLGYAPYFAADRIIGAGSTGDPEVCAKRLVVERLIAEKGLRAGQLLCFGDGVPEIRRAAETGGICVGVLTHDRSFYESAGHFTVSQKRERLIKAGAHILVPDFRDAKVLLEWLCSRPVAQTSGLHPDLRGPDTMKPVILWHSHPQL